MRAESCELSLVFSLTHCLPLAEPLDLSVTNASVSASLSQAVVRNKQLRGLWAWIAVYCNYVQFLFS